MLFEMLTGRGCSAARRCATRSRPCSGPRPNGIGSRSPPRPVSRLLGRCLERDPRERLHDFADARIEISQALRELERPDAAADVRWGSSPALLAWAIAVLAVLAAVTLATRKPPGAPRVSRLLLRLQPRLLAAGGFALSPDGAQVAYVANGQIHVRALDREDVRALPDARGSRPFFSPDGTWIGFVGADELLSKVEAAGGPVVRVTDPPHRVGHCSWAPDDTILCTQPSSPRPGELLRIPAMGGRPQPLPTTESGARERALWPHVLPGGRAVLLTIPSPAGGRVDDATIVVQQLATGERRALVQEGTQAVYSATGHIVFGRGALLMAMPFELATQAARGAPLPVAEHVSRDTVLVGDTRSPGTARSSTSGAPATSGPCSGSTAGDGPSAFPRPRTRFSTRACRPTGSRIAVQGADADNDVWICDSSRGSLGRLTYDPGEDETPVWLPDGSWLAWVTQRSGRPRQVMRRLADGSGDEEIVWSTDRHAHLHDWSPDGKELLSTRMPSPRRATSGSCPWRAARRARSCEGRSRKATRATGPTAGGSPTPPTSRGASRSTCCESPSSIARRRFRSRVAIVRCGARAAGRSSTAAQTARWRACVSRRGVRARRAWAAFCLSSRTPTARPWAGPATGTTTCTPTGRAS